MSANPAAPFTESALKLDTKQSLAEFLDVTTRTLDNWIAAKKIPVIRLGRVVRFRRERVLAALDRFETSAVGDTAR